ncbi:MAG: Holliday junction branch migration protein RuvA [Acidiferrobacterales bacterium]|nr:Holliday junction branch migration protein RuvA [Acidiferrobacterales bacterium]
MIGYLSGLIRQIKPPYVLLDVNGVGYEVHMPVSEFQNFPAEGERADIYTHLHVREDTQALFGFSSVSDRELFRVLITISNVGPRIGLAILSDLNIAEVVTCVQLGDTKPLEKVPGIGAKTAEKLLIELRDKIKQFAIEDVTVDGELRAGNAVREAIEALVELGYSNRDARQAIMAARESTDATSTEELIREALSALSAVAS